MKMSRHAQLGPFPGLSFQRRFGNHAPSARRHVDHAKDSARDDEKSWQQSLRSRVVCVESDAETQGFRRVPSTQGARVILRNRTITMIGRDEMEFVRAARYRVSEEFPTERWSASRFSVPCGAPSRATQEIGANNPFATLNLRDGAQDLP